MFQLELTFRVADLSSIWGRIAEEYFPDRPDLQRYTVCWSTRYQIRCLASCNVQRRRVAVDPVLQEPDVEWVLTPLLYHEMCHAVLGIPKTVRGRRIMHGREFRALERLHPEIPRLNHWIRSGHWDRLVTAGRARFELQRCR